MALQITTNNTTIGSLNTGLAIIELIANADSALKFTEIQEATTITKSNLYKYLNTLTQAGVIYRDPRQGDYTLGYKLLQYGSKLAHSEIIKERLSHYLKEISRLTNMTALIATWVNDRPIITQIANTNYGLNIGATVSTELPPLSAVGKVFAAFKNDEMTELWKTAHLEEGLLNDFNTELKDVKLRKFSYSKEPLIRNVSSISFPLVNYKEEIVAAVGLVGFTDELPSTFDDPFVQKIIPIIAEMSEVFGCGEQNE